MSRSASPSNEPTPSPALEVCMKCGEEIGEGEETHSEGRGIFGNDTIRVHDVYWHMACWLEEKRWN
jgi:hypothetical protein